MPRLQNYCRLLISTCTVFVFLLSSTYIAAAESTGDADSLLKSVIEKFKPTESGKTRFTYQQLDHKYLFNAKGKKVFEDTEHYEVIYLFNQEYRRLLEVNGKPLKGKALRAEQKRYEEAVNAHKGLNARQRTEQAHSKFTEVRFSISRLLSDFDNRIAGRETIAGHNCIIIDSMPKPSVPDAPQRHATIWIDPESAEFVKLSFELLADEDDLQKGSSSWFLMKTINGVSVDTEIHLDFKLTVKKHKEIARIITDSTYSDYKRFSSTAEILPTIEGVQPTAHEK